jgi:hypothetical protein
MKMATKNMARSALEGGRAGYSKYERREAYAEERAEVRDYLKKVMVDPEYAEEEDYDQIRPVRKEFTDKLNPMYRWLKKQVGRSWSDVRSEVFQTFDTRTTAGRHITFDHLLREVVDTESGFDNRGAMMNPNVPVAAGKKKGYRYGGFADYYVDENGILCENITKKRNPYYSWATVSEAEYKEAAAWLNGKIVGLKEGKFFWFTPTEGIWMASWIDPYNRVVDHWRIHELTYYLLDNGLYEISRTVGKPPLQWTEKRHTYGRHWEPIENPFSFRQRCELTKVEIKYFKSLKLRLQQDILEYGKGR